MGNIFLFRHGEALNSDTDNEQLSSEGIRQAENAGKAVVEIIKERYGLFRKKETSPEEFGGLLKIHSGTKRTSSFFGANVKYN